jgi:DNA-binding transcriptional ArsR family regulator
MVDVFDALADENRRKVLELVAKEPRTTAAINKSLKLPATTLDKHLKMLVKTELLSVSVKGKTSTYSLNRKGFAEAAKWFGKFGSSFVAGQADALGESIATLMTSAAGWIENKFGTKINLDFDPEVVGRELGKKLSDVKHETSTKVSATVSKVKAKRS